MTFADALEREPVTLADLLGTGTDRTSAGGLDRLLNIDDLADYRAQVPFPLSPP